jgi:hypothetical protein
MWLRLRAHKQREDGEGAGDGDGAAQRVEILTPRSTRTHAATSQVSAPATAC